MAGKQKISYFYDPDVGNFYYGQVREPRASSVFPPPSNAARDETHAVLERTITRRNERHLGGTAGQLLQMAPFFLPSG